MSDSPSLLRRSAPFLIKLAVSVGLLAVLFYRTDTTAIATRAREMSVAWAAVALGVYGLMILLSAWRWQLLLDTQAVVVRIWPLTQSWLVATFFNNFLPSNIGGDVVRIADSSRLTGSRTVAATVVLVDRAMGLFALLLVAALGSLLATSRGIALPGTSALIAAAALTGLAALVGYGWPRLLPRLLTPLARLRPGLLESRIERLEHTLTRLRARPGDVFGAFLGALLVQLLLVGFFATVAYGLGAALPLTSALVVVPVSLVAQMAPVSVNGFGVREAVFGFYYAQLGLGVEAGLALSLVGTALIMLFSLSGGAVFLARKGARRPPPSTAPAI